MTEMTGSSELEEARERLAVLEKQAELDEVQARIARLEQPRPIVPGKKSRKSAGLAVFLSFMWPGAGHLYVGEVSDKDMTTGIVFTVISGVSFLLSWTIVGLVISIPVWIITAPWTMITSAQLAKQYNAEQGY
jgi:TM2 domain-containing membrane protein YozV